MARTPEDELSAAGAELVLIGGWALAAHGYGDPALVRLSRGRWVGG